MKKIILLLVFLAMFFTQSCTEPYALQTENFENAIVIEASITNEYKHQEIKISHTYKLEQSGPEKESNAVVYITDSNGNRFDFIENGDRYISQQEFMAIPNITYKLHVITSEGKTYISSDSQISSMTNISDVIATTQFDNEGEKGIQIITTSNDSNTGNKFYKYNYEETHKIIAPHWIPQMGIVTYYTTPNADPPGEINMVPRTYEAKTCYSTENSKEIIIQNSLANNNNTVVTPVRFLKKSNYKIAHRYSIKVTLSNQSLAAYNFYDALKKSSSNESLLSQNQPGYYSGNIKNINNLNEKVIGFFEVSHVSSKRIFLNFDDFLPNENKPDYPYNCPPITSLNENDFSYGYCFCYGRGCPTNPICQGHFILSSIYNKSFVIYKFSASSAVLTQIQCGDCTSFASNTRPTFWID